MIHIESSFTFPINLVERAVQAAFAHESQSADTELTIVLTDDVQLRILNRDFLGIDAPTDVLAFPVSESDPETGAPYIGDILISMPYATRSAEKAGHPLESEVQLLAIHGVLHLLGYDHADTDEKARMWKAQAEVLKSIGLSDIGIRDS